MMYALKDKTEVDRSKLLTFNTQRRAERAAKVARNESLILTAIEIQTIEDNLSEIIPRNEAITLTKIINGFQSPEGKINAAGPMVCLFYLNTNSIIVII